MQRHQGPDDWFSLKSHSIGPCWVPFRSGTPAGCPPLLRLGSVTLHVCGLLPLAAATYVLLTEDPRGAPQ